MQHTVQLSHLSTGILVLELKNNEKYWNRHSDSYTSRLQINPHKPTSERLNYFKYFWKALHTDIFPSGQSKLMIYVNSSRHILFAPILPVGGSRGGAWEGLAPLLIFRPNWGPKGWKKLFWRPDPPSLSLGLDDWPRLTWRPGSATDCNILH